MKSVGAILAVFVSVVVSTSLNWKRYRRNEITKKSFVVNTAIVAGLFITGSLLLATDFF